MLNMGITSFPCVVIGSTVLCSGKIFIGYLEMFIQNVLSSGMDYPLRLVTDRVLCSSVIVGSGRGLECVTNMTCSITFQS